MDSSIDAIITRTKQSFYSDGLWELLAGGILLLGGLAILGAPDGNTGAIIYAFGIMALFYLYSWVKVRYIYPHSGFAIYKEQGLIARLFTILKRSLLLVILLVVYLFLQSQSRLLEHRWLSLLLGIFIAAGWIWQGWKVSLPRLILVGIASLLIGVGLSPILPLAFAMEKSALETMGIYFLSMGGVFLVSGSITFWRYLRREWQDQGDAR